MALAHISAEISIKDMDEESRGQSLPGNANLPIGVPRFQLIEQVPNGVKTYTEMPFTIGKLQINIQAVGRPPSGHPGHLISSVWDFYLRVGTCPCGSDRRHNSIDV